MFETGTSDSELGGKYSYEIGYHEPWIDDKHTSLSVNVFNKLLYRFSSSFIGGSGEVDGQTYNERRKGADIGLSRPLSAVTRAFLTVRSENVQTTDIASTTGSGIVAENGDIASGTFRLVRNTRDYDLDPSKGWYKSASLELGQANVTEQFATPPPPASAGVAAAASEPPTIKGPFQKLQFDLRRYWSKKAKTSPTDKTATIAARVMGGIAAGEIPFFEQYFVGGAESVRGYREDRFWGDKMMLASVEYRKPIGNSLTGVGFVDYGSAWGGNQQNEVEDFPQSESFQGHFGVGLGLRVNTPIGNLRLDYGVGSEGGRTHFSIGHAF
jgi:outer membrane protein insertion porin family